MKHAAKLLFNIAYVPVFYISVCVYLVSWKNADTRQTHLDYLAEFLRYTSFVIYESLVEQLLVFFIETAIWSMSIKLS